MVGIIGVDIGGTFTDVVSFADGALTDRKVPTTPTQSQGVIEAVEGVTADTFLHGTTIATNTLLQEQGARVVLVTDSGYEDLIEIGRQDRPSLYDSYADRPHPLVSREDRIGYQGDVEAVVRAVRAAAPEVVAVGLLEAYLDATPEHTLASRLAETLRAPILESSLVSPEFREYERLATTVLSAYLTPSVTDYLAGLDASLPMKTRLVMTSSGGLIPFAQASGAAGRLVLSGPAAGAVAAAALGRRLGYDTVVSFDMGGTSTDVCRITGGELAIGSGHTVGGRVNRVPAVPVRTIGAGGGSVGWVDPGGALRVGPRSAGAVPGPAAYRRGGTEPTVTDANLVVGNIPADLALAGSVRLHFDAALEALRQLGETMGMSAEEAARGMLEVVDSHMEHALRSVSVEEGADPRGAVLVAFGGAGGMHGPRLARRLGIRKVLVPPLSGVFSALGLLLAAPRTDVAQTVMIREGDDGLEREAVRLESEASHRFEEVFGSLPQTVSVSADVRYVGQSHELEVPGGGSWPPLRRAFEEAHEQRFGFIRPGETVELVNLRATAVGSAPLAWEDLPVIDDPRRPVGENGVWDRDTLPPGQVIEGPAVIMETNSAVLIQDGDRLEVLQDGTLEITT